MHNVVKGYISLSKPKEQSYSLNYEVYSRVDENYKSDNSNTLDIIQKYININGNKGIWVLDMRI